MQLLDTEDETFLRSLSTRYQDSSDICREVFIHWLDATKKPTWGKILKALNQKSVRLPNVADSIKQMLDKRVSTHVCNKLFSVYILYYVNYTCIYVCMYVCMHIYLYV